MEKVEVDNAKDIWEWREIWWSEDGLMVEVNNATVLGYKFNP
jgi:hypothetical protein